MAKGQHRSDAPNLSKGTDRPKHSADTTATTVPIRADYDKDGRLTGFGVGREAGDGNYKR
jgi:hypothetical protein